jgi:hypothetical protein
LDAAKGRWLIRIARSFLDDQTDSSLVRLEGGGTQVSSRLAAAATTTKTTTMMITLLTTRRWMLLAILAAGARCQEVQHMSAVAHSHDDAVGDANFKTERADDVVSGPYNGTAYVSSRKCDRYGYAYDGGGGFYGYDRVNYAQVNDLKTSCKSRASNARGEYTSKGCQPR